MAMNKSRHLVGVIAAKSFTQYSYGTNIYQDECMTLQNYEYVCARNRDHEGKPYGVTKNAILKVTVRVSNMAHSNTLYSRLSATDSREWTIVFNAKYDSETKKLTSYDAGMVMRGHVVSIEEVCNTSAHQMDEDNQMILKVSILLSSITYLGKTANITLPITEKSEIYG